MALFRNKYRVESARLKNWDYSSAGHYFVTICTKNRGCYFGDIKDGKMKLSKLGGIAEKYWLEIPDHFPKTELDAFVVMPNHVHGILVINDDGGAVNRTDVACNVCTTTRGRATIWGAISPKSGSLSTIIRSYKSACTKMINQTRDNVQFAWQARFYDHIIRNHKSLFRIRKYIIENPIKWENDRNNHGNLYM